MSRVTAFATVDVVLRVRTDSWGPDCTIDQIVRQAKEAGQGRIRSLFQKIKMCVDPEDPDYHAIAGVELVAVNNIEISLKEEK